MKRQYPVTRRECVVDTLHGIEIADPYRWLEDADSAETRAWSAMQAELYERYRSATPKFIEQLTAQAAIGTTGTPSVHGDRQFFVRREPDQDHAVLMVADGSGTRALVDPVEVDSSGLTTLDQWHPSPDGALLAYQMSVGGTEDSVLRVLDVSTGEEVAEPIERCRYSPVAWLADGSGFFYTRRLRPDLVPRAEDRFHRRVYLHRLGLSPDDDAEIFGAGLDKTTRFDLSVSASGRWLIMSAGPAATKRNDLWLADLDDGSPETPEWQPIITDVDARTAAQVGADGRLYIHTDYQAPRRRLCVADIDHPSAWRDLVGQDDNAVLVDYALLSSSDGSRSTVVVAWSRDTISMLTEYDLVSGEAVRDIPLPGNGSVGSLTSRLGGGTDAWFSYTDTFTPQTVFHYDSIESSISIHAAPAIPNPPLVAEAVDQLMRYQSKDGTEVCLQVFHPSGPLEGSRPCILTGYGGFGAIMPPGYSPMIALWVSLGGVWATAHVRGGGEQGAQWHRAGRREHKQNTFDDFHAAAEYLIGEGMTSKEQLAIMGGSNGGLLVGAAITQRPDLYGAAVIMSPLLDMIRFAKTGLGANWIDEYGDVDKPEEFDWLRSYSPYHKVRDGVEYPAQLYTVADGDSRVDPMHARKMCAAVQDATASNRPVLLRRERESGHGRRSVSLAVQQMAEILEFCAAETGLGGKRATLYGMHGQLGSPAETEPLDRVLER